MAGITQHIPNFVKGISRQPDELKLPGQVRDAKNALPDVTTGMMKRPGARLINTLGFDETTGAGPGSRRDGSWFSLYVSPQESYIGQINKDGRVEIWSTWDGFPRTVKYSTKSQSLAAPSDGVSASPNCDSDLFVKYRNDLTKLDNEIQELELEIDVLQTKRSEWDESDENFTSYDVISEKKKAKAHHSFGPTEIYLITRGIVQQSKGSDVEWTFGLPLEVNEYRPGTKKIGKKLCMSQDSWNAAVRAGDAEGDSIWNAEKWALGRYTFDSDPDRGPVRYQAPDCDVYEVEVENAKQVEPPTQKEINDLKKELKDLEREREDTFELFVGVAASCGTVAKNNTKLFLKAAEEPTSGVLPYLSHEFKEDIQTLGMTDRVLVINRTQSVTMSDDVADVRPCEGYIEMKALAGGRTYSVGFDIADIDSGFNEMKASRLTVAFKGAKNGESWENDDERGACIYTDNELFENIDDPDGNGKGLAFELNTTGSSVVIDPKKPEKGYKCVYTTTVKLLNGGRGWKEGDQVKVTMLDQDYIITISETVEEWTNAEFKAYSTSTAVDGSVTLSSTEVLTSLMNDINGDAALQAFGFEASIIGNGIYVLNTQGIKFNIVTDNWELLNTFGTQVSTAVQLPTQCKAGYLLKIANSSADEDDYYVQFFGTDGTPNPQGDITPQGGIPNTDKENTKRKSFGSDGPGAWYEVAKPGLPNIMDQASMPHQIRRTENEDGNAEFIVQPLNWADREVGDDITNPVPRFVGLPAKFKKKNGEWSKKTRVEPRYINNAIFYRNRLAFLTGAAIVMSQPIDNFQDEQFNFWKTTATTLTDSDVIDVVVTNKSPTTLYDALPVNTGLLLFSPTQQYLLSTDQDVLSPKTANVNEISSYRYNERTNPISMGTTVGFMSNAGKNGRFFEMTNISRDREAEVLEQSKIIADLIPENLNLLSHSKENTILIAGDYLDRELWVYRYFNDGVERKQSAWVRWELTGDLVWQTIIEDVLYIIVRNYITTSVSGVFTEVVTMQRMDLKETDWTAVVQDYQAQLQGNPDNTYSVHMDNYRVVWPTSMQYYPHLDQTYFRLPIGYFSDKTLAAYTLKYGKFQGRAIYPRIEEDAWGRWCVLDGNCSDTRLMLGYEFEFGIELPTIYPTSTTGKVTKSDISGSLVIHRIHLSLGANGVYETKLVRVGHEEEYIQMYEAKIEDGYLADDVAIDPIAIQTVPIYDRNTNFQPKPNGIFITSNHPTPCVLQSMTWEGDFNNKGYKRV